MSPHQPPLRKSTESKRTSPSPTSLPFSFSFPLLVVACALLVPALTSCKAKQKVTTKSMRYAIDQGAWDKSGEKDDSAKIRKKFGADFNEVFGDDPYGGDAKRSSLEDKMFDHRGKDISKEEYRGVRELGELEEFRTPEYLRRQEFRDGTRTAGEADVSTRDGQMVFRDGERNYRGGNEELTFWQKLNPFSKKQSRPARETGKVYRTGDYDAGNRAQDEALVPQPMATFGDGPGDYRDHSMSMDDVRKLLSPEAFR